MAFLVAASVVGGWVLLRIGSSRTTLEVRVTSRTWTLTVAGFEPWVTRDSSPCDELPPRATVLSRRDRETTRVNRSGSRVEHREWCDYEHVSRNRAASAQRSGRFGEEPTWPAEPSCASCTEYVKESEYRAELTTADGERLSCRWYDELPEWQALQEGRSYRVEVGLSDHHPYCGTLKPVE